MVQRGEGNVRGERGGRGVLGGGGDGMGACLVVMVGVGDQWLAGIREGCGEGAGVSWLGRISFSE